MAIPKPEFPRPDRERKNWMNLNGKWEFRLFPTGEEDKEAAFAKKRAAYSDAITVPFSWVCPLSGVEKNVSGTGWYAKTVDFPKGGRLFLCFGAVDYTADVYVNGTLAGSHQGGYSAFEFEVTELWMGENDRIEVRANDERRETQLYGKQGYGEIQGIWQTVWLERRPESYVRDFRIHTKCDGRVTVEYTLDAPDGAKVFARFDGKEYVTSAQNGQAKIEFTLAEPRLWSPEEPNLYFGSVGVEDDEVSTYFGVREITCANVGGRDYQWILLNGKPIYLNGTLDQAFNPEGHFTYPTDRDMHDEAWRLKRLGLNMVRIHIKPEEPRKLYWMDRLGVLVMADIPCFWGAPVEEAKQAYEREMEEIMARDLNHPSIFAWVVFNESWGLLDKENGEKVYRPETREWVRSIYKKAKAIDPERIVEDNSPCRFDHVETDINTWHFYLNGYEIVRDHIREVVDKTFVGSDFNYIGGNRQTGVPLMNSECGMVWGVDNSAGDSDLAWNYHYMLNEYRLHEKLCGFIFTEFHDVVNEFNGYYRIDDSDKEFGYGDFCRGMSIRDLHAADFVAVDCAPMQTVKGGETVSVPLTLSSFTDAHHGQGCSLYYELWHDAPDGRVTDETGEIALPEFTFGAAKLRDLTVTMPECDAAAILSLYLKDEKGSVISRNFTTFDVRGVVSENVIAIPVCEGKTEGFAPVWTALENDKLCMGGAGSVSYDVKLEGKREINGMRIILEGGAKRVLAKDRHEIGDPEADLGFMRGYLVDRGAFENSYWMTDESRFPSDAEVLIDGEKIGVLHFENDFADARGMLSWHRQPDPRKLDEAGSYGELKTVAVPSRLLTGIAEKGGFTLTFKVSGKGGLALYGRECGRYAQGLSVELL